MIKFPTPWTSDRQSRRRAIRAELAEIEIRRRRADELAQELAALDERADRAADLHAARCQPLQQELAAVETAIREAITDRRKVAKGDESRRQELLDELADANETLERETQFVTALRKPLAAEKHQLVMQTTKSQSLENDLCNEENGSPERLDEGFVARQAADWLHHRRRAAEAALAKAESQLRDVQAHDKATRGRMNYARDIEILERKVRRWNLEIDAVVKQQQAADAELRRIREALIDE